MLSKLYIYRMRKTKSRRRFSLIKNIIKRKMSVKKTVRSQRRKNNKFKKTRRYRGGMWRKGEYTLGTELPNFEKLIERKAEEKRNDSINRGWNNLNCTNYRERLAQINDEIKEIEKEMKKEIYRIPGFYDYNINEPWYDTEYGTGDEKGAFTLVTLNNININHIDDYMKNHEEYIYFKNLLISTKLKEKKSQLKEEKSQLEQQIKNECDA